LLSFVFIVKKMATFYALIAFYTMATYIAEGRAGIG
jgi:hypothetical protein